MGTHSTISAFGKTINCHYDGYRKGVGKTLEEHYTSPEKIQALMDLGNIKSLGSEVAPPEGQPHIFPNYVDDVTVALHRDMGRKLEYHKYRDEEFNYVWLEDENRWACYICDM